MKRTGLILGIVLVVILVLTTIGTQVQMINSLATGALGAALGFAAGGNAAGAAIGGAAGVGTEILLNAPVRYWWIWLLWLGVSAPSLRGASLSDPSLCRASACATLVWGACLQSWTSLLH